MLRTLIVKLIHKVPEQHLLESFAGSHAPSPETIRRFRKFVELKKGTYTPEEDRIINKNWKEFCKVSSKFRKKINNYYFKKKNNLN